MFPTICRTTHQTPETSGDAYGVPFPATHSVPLPGQGAKQTRGAIRPAAADELPACRTKVPTSFATPPDFTMVIRIGELGEVNPSFRAMETPIPVLRTGDEQCPDRTVRKLNPVGKLSG